MAADEAAEKKSSRGNDEEAYFQLATDRLRDVLKEAGAKSIDAWTVTLHKRKSGKSSGQFDSYYVSPEGVRHRSLRSVKDAVAPPQPGAPAANGHTNGDTAGAGAAKATAAGSTAAKAPPTGPAAAAKRKRSTTTFLGTLQEQEAVLAQAAKQKAKRLREAGRGKGARRPGKPRPLPQRRAGAPGVSGATGAPGAGTDDIDVCNRPKGVALLAFDPQRHPFRNVLRRAKAQISRLLQEQHTLQIHAADASKSKKVVKQTHEMKRAQDQISRSQQVIRECLKLCEEADGHKSIPDDLFDENGEVDFEHILCAACDEADADDDNDILLCDGEFCNRAYHVACMPFLHTFRVDDLPEDEGWLCPACDCRADIMWELAQAFENEFDYHELIKTRWGDVLVGDELMRDLLSATGPATILNTELPSEDEDDEDFKEDSDDEDDEQVGEGTAAEGRADANGASTSAAARDAVEDGADDEDDDDEDDGGEEGKGDDDGDDEDDSGDDDFYEDDTDEEGGAGDAAAMIAALLAESEIPPEDLVLTGKRRRGNVDYAALNQEMFGDVECYDGEGVSDGEFEPGRAPRQRGKAADAGKAAAAAEGKAVAEDEGTAKAADEGKAAAAGESTAVAAQESKAVADDESKAMPADEGKAAAAGEVKAMPADEGKAVAAGEGEDMPADEGKAAVGDSRAVAADED